MITKPEKIIKRIIKAAGQRQSVLIIGDWDGILIKGIQNNENSISNSYSTEGFSDNIFTRIIADYSLCNCRGLWPQTSTVPNMVPFYMEVRRLLLPTGMLIISANCQDGLFDKFTNLFNKKKSSQAETEKIKPKILQDQIHDNGFLIDGYYGYPGGHLLMMAQIQNKEVTTLFNSKKQETIKA